MTELTVKHEHDSGAAVIEIRGVDISETRFRLRDPYSEKYLTKRGWSKAAAFLPGSAVRGDGVLALTLDADLARKIVPGTNLVLEQPTADFQELLTWPLPVATPIIEALADEPQAAEVKTDETPAAETPAEEIDAPKGPAPLLLDSFEPSIMHDDLHEDKKPADEPKADPAYLADNDNSRSTWKPAAMAAGLFFVLGLGLGTFWLGSDSTAIKEVRQTAAMQLEKQKWEFDRQLKEAKQEASTVKLDKSNASDARIASLASKSDQLAADRDAARKALADKEKSIAALQKQLTDANAQIAAVTNAAGDEAKAQIDALDQKVASLGGELDKANSELAARDQALRDSKAKLSEANDQITANQETAKQEAEALNDELAKQTGELTVQLDQAKQQLAARDRDLKDAQAKLDDANTEIASVRDAAKSQAATTNTSLSEKINTLTAEVKQGEKQLAERDAALRDVQAKLSVANIQVDALKVVAGKTTEAGLEKTAISEKLAQLTAELDKTSQNLSDREQALTDATAKLRDTETKLAAANKRNEQLSAEAQKDPSQTQVASDETTGRLQEERDLYANELKTMTGNFSTLQAEKAKLEKTVTNLQSQIKETNLATSQIPSKAIWGATAVDQSGAIYSLQNQLGEKLAQENVTAMCRGKSRSRCEALTTYNNACFSVARFQGEGPASDNYAYFVHKDWKTASKTALERCQSMGTSCTVRFTACSPDGLSKPVSE